jgi:hypothetical protein
MIKSLECKKNRDQTRVKFKLEGPNDISHMIGEKGLCFYLNVNFYP